ncbi:hypothetical protein [Kitasatospora griseola]|uniref:hypothetical protein n=1 Tax=Kitasatospora griseola TaxID=2064 RepID=UPI00342512DF
MIDEGTPGADDGAPTTTRLREVFDRAGHVVIVEGPPDEAEVPGRGADLGERPGIAEPARLPAASCQLPAAGGTGDRCPCSSGPTIIVHDIDGEPIACWGPHHGTGLGGIGDRDAEPRDGPARTTWLADRGLTGSRDVQAELAEPAAER